MVTRRNPFPTKDVISIFSSCTFLTARLWIITAMYSSLEDLIEVSTLSQGGDSTIADNFHETCVAKCTHSASPICLSTDSLVACKNNTAESPPHRQNVRKFVQLSPT